MIGEKQINSIVYESRGTKILTYKQYFMSRKRATYVNQLSDQFRHGMNVFMCTTDGINHFDRILFKKKLQYIDCIYL